MAQSHEQHPQEQQSDRFEVLTDDLCYYQDHIDSSKERGLSTKFYEAAVQQNIRGNNAPPNGRCHRPRLNCSGSRWVSWLRPTRRTLPYEYEAHALTPFPVSTVSSAKYATYRTQMSSSLITSCAGLSLATYSHSRRFSCTISSKCCV